MVIILRSCSPSSRSENFSDRNEVQRSQMLKIKDAPF